jgi:AcrR family transcriptional regulator
VSAHSATGDGCLDARPVPISFENHDGSTRKGEVMRGRIIDAAERIIVEGGVVAATTKAVAREAGCAEGTIYVHFPDRLSIFSAIFEKRWPMAAEALEALRSAAGSGDVVGNLTGALQKVTSFLVALEPLIAGIKSDPTVSRSLHERWCQIEVGPQVLVESLTSYLAAERAAGRVAAGIEPELAAETLLGFVFFSLGKAKFSPGSSQVHTEAQLRKVICTNVRPVHA